jgi:hypothetical protein
MYHYTSVVEADATAIAAIAGFRYLVQEPRPIIIVNFYCQ